MQKSFLKLLYKDHHEAPPSPPPDWVDNWATGLLSLLFPALSNRHFTNPRELELEYNHVKYQLSQILAYIKMDHPCDIVQIEENLYRELPDIRSRLLADANAILNGDPAANSLEEVIHTYPGFFAMAIHRIAHKFFTLGTPLLPRILSEFGHAKTGIDIHPGAIIGDKFCIDHGTGIVIGETVTIGNHVKIYQGVTLGALSVQKELAKTKRHPTIEDDVVIYANATILGGDTVIGKGSIIGGNTWITKSVAAGERVYYKNKNASS